MDITALGREPVRPDQPAGEDVRYDPLFDQLQAEVDRGALPSLAGTVDWEKVVDVASQILSHKSKDLLVAGYLAVGLIHTRGLDGLALGLKIHRDLLEHHGPDLFPQRERGRIRSVEWWLEKCEAALKMVEGTVVSPVQLATIEEHLARLGQLHAEMLPEAPSLQVLRDFLQRAAAPGAGAADRVQESPDPYMPERALPGRTWEADSLRESPPAPERADPLQEGLLRLRQAAGMLLEQEILNPLPYRLARQAAWLEIDSLPPVKAGRTLIPPPPLSLRSRLADLQLHGESSGLIREVEAQLGQFIFWFDLNRISAEALADLDPSQTAAAAISQEVSFLLRRLPGIEELCFADGTPFSDGETRQWLLKHGKVQTGEMPLPPAGTGGMVPAPESLIAEEEAAAAALAGEGRLTDAVDRLQDRLNNRRSGREQLQWRLVLCRVLIQAEQAGYALPQLEQVVTEIADHGLERYDPGLALEGLELAWHGFKSQHGAGYEEKARALLNRIARLDAGEVIRLVKGERLEDRG